MSIFIYNSLSRKKEEFIPLKPSKVNIYTCGVTVYDECHIGHARSLYIFDVIRRYLKYRNYDVTFVRNITDIDDKIINKANQEEKSAKEIAQNYIESYYKDLEALGIPKADFEPKATENIPEMLKHIEALIEKDFAYVVDGDVYFSVRKFKEYGKLSGQSIEQILEAVRIEKDRKKKDPLDFALWKKSKEDEPFWLSPWGNGRPGWHIECSVMSQKFLKTDTLDIHAGGRDLIFPHHENEIAQSEALTGKPFAKYWIHHGLLTINGQKMSKSLGNFITIKNFMDRYKDVDILKLFFLSAHYSHPIDFTDKKIDDAKKMKERIAEFMDMTYPDSGNNNSTVKNKDFILRIKDEFVSSMDDDFNTPRALSCVHDLIRETYKYIEKSKSDSDHIGVINNALSHIREWLQIVFGLNFIGSKHMSSEKEKGKRLWKFLSKDFTKDLSDEEFVLIQERTKARNNNDYAKSDKLRIELEKKGIIAKDTKEGSIYQRKS